MPTTQGRPPTLTIEELARRAGLSTRNVRAYRTAGLLSPPLLEGRTGRYGDEHLRRLVVIGRLQRRGWSLAAIRDALAAQGAGRSLEELLGLSGEAGRVAQMTAQVADEVGDDLTVREAPAAVDALEAIVIAPGDDRLERQVGAGLRHREVGTGRR